MGSNHPIRNMYFEANIWPTNLWSLSFLLNEANPWASASGNALTVCVQKYFVILLCCPFMLDLLPAHVDSMIFQRLNEPNCVAQ